MNAGVTVVPRPVDVSAYYSHRHPEAFDVDWRAFYRSATERTLVLRRSFQHDDNILYGSHPNQTLDIYYPQGARPGCPVLIFLHGGAFQEGHPAHYGFLARPYLKRAAIFVSAGYRLIPDCYFPESSADVAEAIAWVYHNIGQRGGDPNRIVLSGHSAGAMLSASVAVRTNWQKPLGLPGDAIKGAVMISGRYDLSAADGAPVRDQAERAQVSPINTVERAPASSILAFGPAERNRVGQQIGAQAEQAHALANVLRRVGGSVSIVALDGLDHPQTAAALGDQRSPLFRAVIKLMLRAPI